MKTFLSTFIVLFFTSTAGYADVLRQETFLSNQFSEVLRSYDERGVVKVDIELNQKKVQLPGTNFLVSSNDIGKLSKKNVKSVTVHVFSEKETLPKTVEDFFRSEIEKISKKSNIKLITLEKGLRDNSLQMALDSSVEKLSASLGGSEQLLYVIGMIPFILLIVGYFMKTQMQKSVEILNGQLQMLSSALQEQGIGTTPNGNEIFNQSKDSSSQSTETSTVIEKNMWEVMGEDFYNSLLSDCYWCELDQYASFIWGKTPIEMKKNLLNSSAIDKSYLKFISAIEPVDLGLAKHSYYLSPWKVEHISNEDLFEIVRSDFRFYSYLSPLRNRNANFTLDEKLRCLELGPSTPMQEELFAKKIANTKQSEKRALDLQQNFNFSSFEEEEKILEMDLTFDQMKKFPTIGWLLKLSSEEIAEIISSYQVKDFAGALYCADSIKEKIIECAPEKRQDLLRSYASKITGSQNSTYLDIIQKVFKYLEEKDREVEDEGIKIA